MKPVVINVFGDKSKKIEPESHRIMFPGGAISVERTTTGEYLAHIHVNTEAHHARHNGDFVEGHSIGKLGRIVDSRIDFDHDMYVQRRHEGKPGIGEIDSAAHAEHIAVKLRISDHE